MLEVNEPINVWVFFKASAILPHTFFWKERQIKVEQINLVHTTREGSNVYYHFSISAGGNFYRLRLDNTSLKWSLEALEEG